MSGCLLPDEPAFSNSIYSLKCKQQSYSVALLKTFAFMCIDAVTKSRTFCPKQQVIIVQQIGSEQRCTHMHKGGGVRGGGLWGPPAGGGLGGACPPQDSSMREYCKRSSPTRSWVGAAHRCLITPPAAIPTPCYKLLTCTSSPFGCTQSALKSSNLQHSLGSTMISLLISAQGARNTIGSVYWQ